MDRDINFRMDLSWMKFEFSPCSVSFDKREYNSDKDFLRHTHDFSQMIYCFEGEITHSVGDNVYECLSGDMVIIPPGIFHEFHIKKGSVIGYLNIAYNAFQEERVKKYPATTLLGIFPRNTDLLNVDIPYRLSLESKKDEGENVLEALLAENDTRNARTDELLLIAEKFFSLVFPVSASMAESAVRIYSTRLCPVISAMDYLNTHYARKVHCDDILREILLCSTDFYEYFRSFIHTTYSLYLQTVRVSRAHRAIAFTPYSLSYIANMCGFGDNTYMTKCYKKHKGHTPTEERMRMNISKPEYAHLRISHDFFDLPQDTDRK